MVGKKAVSAAFKQFKPCWMLVKYGRKCNLAPAESKINLESGLQIRDVKRHGLLRGNLSCFRSKDVE